MRIGLKFTSILLFAILHIWNIFIAYEYGTWKGLMTIIGVFIADIYWFIKLFNIMSVYTATGIVVFLLMIFTFLDKKLSKKL